MPLRDLIDKKFEVRTRPVEDEGGVPSLGTTAQEVLPNNPNRLAWILVNLSENTVYLALKSDVSSSSGIRLDANGGSAGMVWDEDFDVTGWAIYGVAADVNSAIFAYEVVTYA